MDYGIIIHHDGLDLATLQACADAIFGDVAGALMASTVAEAMDEARECVECGECFAWWLEEDAFDAAGRLALLLPYGAKVFVVRNPVWRQR
jgi:hypothetical protein